MVVQHGIYITSEIGDEIVFHKVIMLTMPTVSIQWEKHREYALQGTLEHYPGNDSGIDKSHLVEEEKYQLNFTLF